jgi:hypothetical protein
MGIILSPDEHRADIPDVFTKNRNNPSSVRVTCAGCHLFLGVLGQWHPLPHHPSWPHVKGHRIVICEELKVFTPAQTVQFLRRIKANPNLADRKGCGQLMVFSPTGQLLKSLPKGTEAYNTFREAVDKLAKDRLNAAQLKAWQAKAQQAMDRFTTAAKGRIYSR